MSTELSNKSSILTDPQTGAELSKREQPGYYPGFSTLEQKAYWDAATRDTVLERISNAPPIRFFSQSEAETMSAVMNRIMPQDDRTPERQIPLLPFLDHRLYVNRIEGYRYEDMPSDQDVYRIAAKAFDEMARSTHHKPFHELEVRHQEELIRDLHHADPPAAGHLWQKMNIERFWAMLVSDCVSAYYSHPWAWDEIGFGGPAYPRGYMRLEDGEAEPWEVNEKRYEWAAPRDTISDTSEPFGSGLKHQTQPGQGGTH